MRLWLELQLLNVSLCDVYVCVCVCLSVCPLGIIRYYSHAIWPEKSWDAPGGAGYRLGKGCLGYLSYPCCHQDPHTECWKMNEWGWYFAGSHVVFLTGIASVTSL